MGLVTGAQIFLLFEDNTYYEFYSSAGIEGISNLGLGSKEDVKGFCNKRMRVEFEFPETT